MVARFVAALLALSSIPAVALAQQQPLRSIEPEMLPPLAPAPETALPPNATPPAGVPPPPAAAASGAPAMSAPMSAPAERVFCEQPVTAQVAELGAVAQPYRPFVGIWSDASWTPQLCAALIVENVTPDGTATILYLFGPMGSNVRGTGGAPGGILHGTGIIRDGELRFQNSDGSQFAFRPLYADLDGRLTTPKDQNYHAIFKKTP